MARNCRRKKGKGAQMAGVRAGVRWRERAAENEDDDERRDERERTRDDGFCITLPSLSLSLSLSSTRSSECQGKRRWRREAEREREKERRKNAQRMLTASTFLLTLTSLPLLSSSRDEEAAAAAAACKSNRVAKKGAQDGKQDAGHALGCSVPKQEEGASVRGRWRERCSFLAGDLAYTHALVCTSTHTAPFLCCNILVPASEAASLLPHSLTLDGCACACLH